MLTLSFCLLATRLERHLLQQLGKLALQPAGAVRWMAWFAHSLVLATERLISGMFKATAGQSVGDALAAAQHSLMDDAATSHPFYWSGFAVVGDGAQAMLSRR